MTSRLVSFALSTIERWKPESTLSGSIWAIAPFVRWLAKRRKWSFRFGAFFQIESIERRPAEDGLHVVGRREIGVGDDRAGAGPEEPGGVVVDPLLGLGEAFPRRGPARCCRWRSRGG